MKKEHKLELSKECIQNFGRLIKAFAKEYVPTDSYPPEDYRPKQNARGHCDACGLPKGRVYPKQHRTQTEEFECIQCGATWYELPTRS